MRVFRLQLVALLLTTMGFGQADPDTQGISQLLVISNPPTPVLASDPPKGVIFWLDAQMAAADIYLQVTEGPRSLEYLTFSPEGLAYLTFDDGVPPEYPGGIMRVAGFQTGSSRITATALQYTYLGGLSAGLQEPKDILYVTAPDGDGRVVVADFATAEVRVFNSQLSDLEPLFVISDLGGNAARSVWGLAYDPSDDRLFVSTTDGYLLIYDELLTHKGQAGPDRIITPVLAGEQVSYNLHGMVYLAEADRLIVTDVGATTTFEQGADFASNGAILVLDGVSTASGQLEPRVLLAGPQTLLGNPVDVVYDQGSIFVAERANNLILRFDNILEYQGRVDAAPDAAISVPAPASILLLE